MGSYATDGINDAPRQAVLEVAPRGAEGPSAGAVTSAGHWELSGSTTPNAPAQRVRISCQPFSVGRDRENALQLAYPTISRHHAELLLVGRDLYVRDTNSRNGTFLNGRRINDFERLNSGDMLQFGTAVFTVDHLHDQTSAKPFNPYATMVESNLGDIALANLQFDKLLGESALVPFYQPIVGLPDGLPLGYEVLARSRLVGLETPAAMFRVAEERGMEADLSELARREGLRCAQQQGLPGELYLNTHPIELQGDRLLKSLRSLRSEFPKAKIVIEIHEAAVTSLEVLDSLRDMLHELEIRLAYDDFGAGQSRLMELADVKPDIIKFDMCLIRGVATASEARQSMIRSLVRMVRDLDVVPLAEGVETSDEAEACAHLGFDLAQGYFFGRPSAAPKWPAPVSCDKASR